MNTVKTILTNLFAYVKNLYSTEPTAVITGVVTVVVFVASTAGIIVPATSILTAVTYILPIIFGGVTIRSLVSPAKKA